MTKATISQAKSRLGSLVDAALRGERVVILRRDKPTVAIVPLESVADAPPIRVTDRAADYLAKEARAELATGAAMVHESPAAFAAAITKPRRRA